MMHKYNFHFYVTSINTHTGHIVISTQPLEIYHLLRGQSPLGLTSYQNIISYHIVISTQPLEILQGLTSYQNINKLQTFIQYLDLNKSRRRGANADASGCMAAHFIQTPSI